MSWRDAIGGLLTSTVLTLIVVPVIFKLIGGWQERRTLRQEATEQARVAPAIPASAD